jgi:hypothetical protein
MTKLFMKGLLIFLLLSGGCGILGATMGWFGEATQVAQEEFGPRAMLQKYEWFKDCAAQLDKKVADISVYQGRIVNMQADYEGVHRKDWPRTDKEQMNLWRTELAGVRASYNMLAAEYNAQMAKFNWSFANAGQLPKGASVPLPREYKPYVEG